MDNDVLTTTPLKRDHETNKPIAPLAFNAERYRAELAGLQMSPAQEEELLRTLWTIMSAFVDLGWGVDSVQNFLPFLKEDFSHQLGSANTLTPPFLEGEIVRAELRAESKEDE